MSSDLTCPVCNTPTEAPDDDGGAKHFTCKRCGKFSIGWLARKPAEYFNKLQTANLSGWIREHQGCALAAQALNTLSLIRTPSVGEKATKLLTYLAQNNPKPGEYIQIPMNQELLGICWAQDLQEINFIFDKYLIVEREFIVRVTDNYGRPCHQITTKGWSYLDDMLSNKKVSSQGFIAMWFDKSVNDAWTAIENGIRNAGYKPFRVDQKEHNNDITDEIIAGIRGSKFLVADLTGHRNGVYYEAGFAKGLGIEVVWLCRKSDEKTGTLTFAS
jgi:hypothetical protein